MSHDNSQNVYRTTPARTGKMLIIMLGICIVGGIIFSQCGTIGFHNLLQL